MLMIDSNVMLILMTMLANVHSSRCLRVPQTVEVEVCVHGWELEGCEKKKIIPLLNQLTKPFET